MLPFSFLSFLLRMVPSATELDIAAILTHSLRQQDPSGSTSQQPSFGGTQESTGPVFNPIAGDDDEEECCGGLIDCEGLVIE